MNEPTAKKLIESAPEHILNMSREQIESKMKSFIVECCHEGIVEALDVIHKLKIAIDWVGDECVCYPFQNVHTPTLGEQATLLSISDRNPRIAIAKAVIWQQEVLAKSN